MQQNAIRILCAILLLVLCLGLLPACVQKTDPLARSEFQSLTVDQKGRVNATVTLDVRTVQAHTGETASIYEIAPGESTSLEGKTPLDSAKVGTSLQFRFPLTEGDHTRLYSSFVLAFSDGSLLSTAGYWIENPQLLASDTSEFAWSGSPKGLLPANADEAAELGVMHAMYEVRFSELLGGSEVITLNGISCTVAPNVLEALDKQIMEATNAGMQVSLTLIPDLIPSYGTVAAVIDHLAARYTNGDRGIASALFVGNAAGLSAIDAAMLCRLSNQALRSRLANGRIYVIGCTDTVIDTKTFFSDLMLMLAPGGEFEWGAAVTPLRDEQSPWEETDADSMTLQNLSEISQFVTSTFNDGHASRFAVTGLAFPAATPNVQAVSYAYAYRLALNAGAGLIFYDAHVEDECGLLSEGGEARRIVKIFSDIDTGLSAEDTLLCEELAGEAWNALKKNSSLISRVTVSGIANVGTGGFEEDPLFDFTSGDTFGFTGVCSLDPPVSHDSAAWSAPVLYTWLDPTHTSPAGVRKILSDGSTLENANSISIHLLTQAYETEACTAYLTIEGTAKNGSRLTYTSNIEIRNGSWQVVTFQIGNFVADADLSRPCILTLTTDPDSATEEPFVLWVKGVDVRRSPANYASLIPLAFILGGVAVGLLVVFTVYRLSIPRRRRRR